MLKTFLVSIALVSLMLLQSVQAAEVKLTDPNKMVRQVADNTFARITQDQPLIVKDKEHLRVIVEEELMPYIDYKYAALRVLGSEVSKVRAITDKAEKAKAIEDIQRFIGAFREYLVATYAGVFTQYTNQQVEFAAEQPFKGKDVVVVKTKIVEAGKPDIKIDFKVREDRSGEWRAYDMIAEGISLLDAKQSELQGILRQQGIDHVSGLLEQKSKLPVQFRGSDTNE
ncbi:MAG: MlaC/ttg2D family ABC transporter substrate-binding protein [Pseudoalteromonas tetraodonis]|jgi:phospholipid transport system substrate-binding protein|uniref:ABC transporter auxiliary component n=1 Tax=Pseudoalteromonas undina TaxID=43660 RepID=A0ABP2XUQ5_9GAMM|nr:MULTISPECIES: ABC transporter substrate-binding protein [Pseudoalteromonas]MBL0688232.1 ABC transporter substrate-binding protein [Pseudoalteromonas sp.]OLF73744.1 toluene tolerance protein [Pseudoalteromonas haloplanktis]KAF7769347.1 phospholipid transport system substrate-binding protein [Pseudoalteromonas undina]KPH90418.1 toluene tolerance protein [Pseudoalteromonas undina]MCK8126422.1 ABC transporter substrate-binding protein [Pseudoalteromonas sp. 2CM39R]|tara:strand:- start:86 stop:766 length:681 start_codon:yes stop_codon:yes gene_type:complete